LNALGYTLTTRTSRYEEAYALIERALELAPDEPAILDSMGWVLFQLGRAEEAVGYLQRAWDGLPDPEVAAHLGEVLWSLGEQQKAYSIWRDGLLQDPEHDILQETLERLDISISDLRPQ
jgi:tetratricopeptide (TPR) repeat protein